MEPDNFDLHIYSNEVSYYHKDLMKLIDSVTEKDKSELEEFANEINKKLGKEIKLCWGLSLGRYWQYFRTRISTEQLKNVF